MVLSELLGGIKNSYCTGFLEHEEEKWYFEKYPVGIFMGKPVGNGAYDDVHFYPAIPKIPGSVLEEIIDYFRRDLEREAVVQIIYTDDVFSINYPYIQYSTKASVSYSFQIPIDALPIMTVHSHNTMPAYFSVTDDEDETMPGLYGVIGNLDRCPQMMFRASLDGSFGTIPVQNLFSLKEIYCTRH